MRVLCYLLRRQHGGRSLIRRRRCSPHLSREASCMTPWSQLRKNGNLSTCRAETICNNQRYLFSSSTAIQLKRKKRAPNASHTKLGTKPAPSPHSLLLPKTPHNSLHTRSSPARCRTNAPAPARTKNKNAAHLAQQRLYERRVEELSRRAVRGSGPRTRRRGGGCARARGDGRGCRGWGLCRLCRRRRG